MQEMERLGEKLAMPMAGLPALKELDIRIARHSESSGHPILLAVLARLMADLRDAFELGQFNGLKSLRLSAATNDFVPLLRSISASDVCSNLQTLYCARQREQFVSYPRTFPGSQGKQTVVIDGQLKARESGSKELLACLVSRCPELKDLTIPDWSLFSRAMRLHPNNSGLKRLAILGTQIRLRGEETEDVRCLKRLVQERQVNLKVHSIRIPTGSMYRYLHRKC